MSYEKQTWNKYDDLKTEEENIENGAVVTDNRMNHIEEGIGDNDINLASHLADKNNPHKVTAAQVGLGNVQNFGLATEDEAKQAISNAKYMTPSLTQAVLSANINSIAYANSADGAVGFTTVYPNLNLLDGTRDFSGVWEGWSQTTSDRIKENLLVKSTSVSGIGIFKRCIVTKDGDYTFSTWVSASDGQLPNIIIGKNRVSQPGIVLSNTAFDWVRVTYTIKNVKSGDELTGRIDKTSNVSGKVSIAGHKWEYGSVATPYMPSSSEVTINDYPKYVGFSNTVKTNKSASDYTWFPVKDSELTNKVESHVNNKANPHAVTASQVGAYSKQEIDTKLSKAVMADDSGKVILKDFEVTTISETVNIGNGLSLNFQRKGEFVLVRFSGSLTAINSGTYFSTAVPDQWRPDGIKELIGHFASGALAFHVDLETDGRVKWWGASGATGAPRGTAMYFLK